MSEIPEPIDRIINPHLQKVVANMAMMSEGGETHNERYEARERAFTEVEAAIKDDMGLGQDEALPDDLLPKIGYVLAFTYRRGFGPNGSEEELMRGVDIDVGYRRRKDVDGMEWLPQDQDEAQSLLPIMRVVARLCNEDTEPAYTANQQGRPHEILDNTGDVYNKYGELITHRIKS